MKVSVKVPATSANIGPGFDCLGMALPIYNIVTIDETVLPGTGVEINILSDEEGVDNLIIDHIPRDETSVVYKAVEMLYNSIGQTPSELKINIQTSIPVTRGLGSSAAVIVGALIAANKSGVSTKKGLIFGAQVVDSTYVGEIHISELNPGEFPQVLKAGEKAIQFIHTPILLTRIEKIGWDGFDGFLENAKNWSERGDNWQGSTDENELKDIEPYNDGPNS